MSLGSVLVVIDVTEVRTILEFGDHLNPVVALCSPEDLGTCAGYLLCEVIGEEPTITKTEHPWFELIDHTLGQYLFGCALGTDVGHKDRMGATLVRDRRFLPWHRRPPQGEWWAL